MRAEEKREQWIVNEDAVAIVRALLWQDMNRIRLHSSEPTTTGITEQLKATDQMKWAGGGNHFGRNVRQLLKIKCQKLLTFNTGPHIMEM